MTTSEFVYETLRDAESSITVHAVSVMLTEDQKKKYLQDLADVKKRIKEIEEKQKRALSWSHETGFNTMCYDCKLRKEKCIGSKNHVWTNCARKIPISEEREMERWRVIENK